MRARLSAAERLAVRAQEEMYKACKRAEQHQSDALKQHQTAQALQVDNSKLLVARPSPAC